MQRLATHVVTSLLVLAVVGQVTPAFASASDAQPQCGDEKKGDAKGGDKKETGDTKPKAPSLG